MFVAVDVVVVVVDIIVVVVVVDVIVDVVVVIVDMGHCDHGHYVVIAIAMVICGRCYGC